MRPERKRRLIDAAAFGGVGLLLHGLSCALWGSLRAGATDPFGYAGGWGELAFARTVLPMLMFGALLGFGGRFPLKSARGILFLALISGLLLAGVQSCTRHWALA